MDPRLEDEPAPEKCEIVSVACMFGLRLRVIAVHLRERDWQFPLRAIRMPSRHQARHAVGS